jgi:hypothetical protein
VTGRAAQYTRFACIFRSRASNFSRHLADRNRHRRAGETCPVSTNGYTRSRFDSNWNSNIHLIEAGKARRETGERHWCGDTSDGCADCGDCLGQRRDRSGGADRHRTAPVAVPCVAIDSEPPHAVAVPDASYIPVTAPPFVISDGRAGCKARVAVPESDHGVVPPSLHVAVPVSEYRPERTVLVCASIRLRSHERSQLYTQGGRDHTDQNNER